MHHLKFHPEAVSELKESILWYEKRSVTAAGNFKTELNVSMQKIKQNPNLSPLVYKSFRTYFLKKFPFKIVYLADNNVIYIISVFHTSRNPKALEDRLGSDNY